MSTSKASTVIDWRAEAKKEKTITTHFNLLQNTSEKAKLKGILSRLAPPAKGQTDYRIKPTLPPDVELKMFEATWKDD